MVIFCERKEKIVGILIGLLAFVFSPFSYGGFSLEKVEIQELSSSGRTLILNRGKVHGLKRGDYAALIHPSLYKADRYFYAPVGNLRLIKIFSRRSIWGAYQVFRPKLMTKGASFLFLSQGDLLKGRRALSGKKRTLVVANNPKDELKDFLLEGDHLSRKKENYSVLANIHEKTDFYDTDAQLIDIDRWEDQLGDEKLRRKAIYRSPHAKEFSRRRKVRTFEKMTAMYLDKLNGVKVTQGDSFHQYSTKKPLPLKASYQAFLGLGLNLVNNENLNDTETSEQNKIDIELGVESYFFRELEELKKFALEFSVRRSQDAFFGEQLNVKTNQWSLATQLNWYPFQSPAALNTNIIFLGVLVRFGFASLSNQSFGESGRYQLSSLPGLRGGIKYQFSNTYGIRLAGSFEKIVLDRVSRNVESPRALGDKMSYLEGKLAVSLSKLF